MLTWTIGAGGLIGSAVNAQSAGTFGGSAVPWADRTSALTTLTDDLARFAHQVRGQSWGIVWAAGAATTSTGEAQAMAEADFFRSFSERLADQDLPREGAVFVCSSAGGVHAGSPRPPFDESTPPAPLGPYGRARLAQEQAAGDLLGPAFPVVIGRISNVYGPGQKLDKLQGLISRLATSAITREPLNLFVPLATVRDYIYVSDVAARVHEWLAYAAGTGTPGASLRILASGQGTSVGQLVRMAQGIAHRKVPIAMGSHPSSTLQAPDLRFVPSVVPGTQPRPGTPMPVGMKHVFDDIRWRLQHADVG